MQVTLKMAATLASVQYISHRSQIICEHVDTYSICLQHMFTNTVHCKGSLMPCR